MARVVIPFDGVRDGEVYPTRFDLGDEVSGALAAVALAEGWAVNEVLTVAAALADPVAPLKRMLSAIAARVRALLGWLRGDGAR